MTVDIYCESCGQDVHFSNAFIAVREIWLQGYKAGRDAAPRDIDHDVADRFIRGTGRPELFELLETQWLAGFDAGAAIRELEKRA